MRDKILRAELPDRDVSGRGQRMPRIDHETQLVAKDDHGLHLRIVRAKREHADLDRMHQHLVRDTAGERSLHRDFDIGVLAAVLIEQREQVQAGVFVGGKIQTAAMQGA